MSALTTAAAYGAALLLTLVLAAFLTPAGWWRRLNARAAAIVVGGTWALGSLIAGPVQARPPDAVASSQRPAASYTVVEALNLRDGTGINAKRVAVVPAGSMVEATGARRGDWWQVRAKVGGDQVTGWASSLWLRRPDERLR
jgi:hypothetical protein